jgi:hypothetical protein
MTRKSLPLAFGFVGLSLFAVRGASAQFLPGNAWPNPGLSTAAPAGIDQVYSFYNVPFYTPNATGDTNPRPNGWHRGGGDFGVTTTPNFCFYNTPGNSAGEGTAPPGNSDGYALEVNDSNVNGYGEWFSDWDALPAITPSNQVYVRFFYENTNVQPRGDTFRVTVNFGDAVTQDISTGDPNNLGHTDFLIPGGSPDNTTWTEVDEALTVPAGAQSMRITEDSGGSGAATGQIWLSDISVSSVPEPASIAALGGAAILIFARRRRA